MKNVVNKMNSVKSHKKKIANQSDKTKSQLGNKEEIIVNRHCLSAIKKVEKDQALSECQIENLSKILMRGEANARCSYYLLIKSKAFDTLNLSPRQFFITYTNCSVAEGYKHFSRGELEHKRFNSAVYIGTYNGAVLDAFISIRAKYGDEIMFEIWDELDRRIASNKDLQITGPLIKKTLSLNLDLKELDEDRTALDSKHVSEQEVITIPKQDYKLLDPRAPDYIVTVLDTIINDDELVNSLDATYISIIRKKLNTALKKVKSFL